MVGFIILSGTIIFSRYSTNKGNKHLEVEYKAKLVDLFGKSNMVSVILSLSAVFGYYFLTSKNLICLKILTICFFGFLFVFMFVQTRIAFKKLKQNDFPEEYIKLYIGSTAVRTFGMVAFLFVLYV